MVEKYMFGGCCTENLSLVYTKAVFLALTGFFIGGPSNMISSAISADLGRQDLVKGSSEALATVTGIVDGTGSIGAAVGQVSLSKQVLEKNAKSVLWSEIVAHSSVNSCFKTDLREHVCFKLQWKSLH